MQSEQPYGGKQLAVDSDLAFVSWKRGWQSTTENRTAQSSHGLQSHCQQLPGTSLDAETVRQQWVDHPFVLNCAAVPETPTYMKNTDEHRLFAHHACWDWSQGEPVITTTASGPHAM
jgi:hypothetical protein